MKRGDKLLAATEKTNGTNFSEIREWVGPIRPKDPSWEKSIMIRFVFTTRLVSKWPDIFDLNILPEFTMNLSKKSSQH